MNRIGWTFLGLFALVAIAAVFLVDFGGGSPSPTRVAIPPAPVAVETVAPPAGALVLPVAGVPWSAIRDNWDEPRGENRLHHGTDIAAPAGTPVVAAAAGTVEKLYYSHGGGGITAYVRSPDRRLSYYYAHLAAYAPDLREGMAVRGGQVIGYVGDTGNAGAGNNHLHFGIERIDPAATWSKGQAINPYPLLARGRSRE